MNSIISEENTENCIVHLWDGKYPGEITETKLNDPFEYSPHPLCEKAYREMMRWEVMNNREFKKDISHGKMFGVLVVQDKKGGIGFIAAFSGQIGNRMVWPGFVPPVYDYLDKHGYFKTREREISTINDEISKIERYELPSLSERYNQLKASVDMIIIQAKRQMSEAKTARACRRMKGVSEEEEGALIRESQFLKAELHRQKISARDTLAPVEALLAECNSRISMLKDKRRQMSESLQRWLFSKFVMLNAKGEEKDINSIFAGFDGKVPPSGSGECCAPKLLQYAYRHGLNHNSATFPRNIIAT